MSDFRWTDDGTLFSNNYEDVYFTDGHGITETEYVFLEANNIRQRMEEQNMVVGELGFGTGLNFLVTWDAWKKHGQPNNKRFTFVTCEKHPLSRDFLEKAHGRFPQFSEMSAELRSKIPPFNSGFHLLEFEGGQVSLLLMYGDVLDVYRQLESKVDAWYLDGFAPKGNPQMWNEHVYKQLAWHSQEKTTLSTYTAVGAVRRGLQDVGFEVERIKGYGRKRHMCRAEFKGYVKPDLHLEPWYRHKSKKSPKNVAIIGGGMAGLNTAYALKRLGVEATIYDKHSEIAQEASGNRWGMVLPLIAKKHDRLGSLTKAGAHFTFNQLNDLGINYQQGLLEFAGNDARLARLSSAIERLPKSYVELLDKEQLQQQFDLDSPCKALLHKYAVSMSPLEYAHVLLKESQAETVLNCRIESLGKRDDGWILKDENGVEYEHDCVVICSAADTAKFSQTDHLPIRRTRGQVLHLKKDDLLKEPTVGLNFVNYLVRDSEGNYVLGATFQPDDEGTEVRPEDSQELIDSFNGIFPGFLKDDIDVEKTPGRVCFRAMQKDHFSIYGAAPDAAAYRELYSTIKHGKPNKSYEDAVYEDGLYVNCGHGSRGLTLSPMISAALARQIVDGFYALPVSHVTAMHAGRFLIKTLKRH